MSFKLNIGGKMTGNGTTGFGQKASAVIEKCKSMANYMGTLQDNLTGGVDGGAGTPGSFSPNYGGTMANKNSDSMAYQTDDEIKLDNVDLPAVESGATRDARIQRQMKKTRSQPSNPDAKNRSQDFAAQKDLTALNNQSKSDPEAYKKNVKRIAQPKAGQTNVNISQADLSNSRKGKKIREDYRSGKTS